MTVVALASAMIAGPATTSPGPRSARRWTGVGRRPPSNQASTVATAGAVRGDRVLPAGDDGGSPRRPSPPRLQPAPPTASTETASTISPRPSMTKPKRWRCMSAKAGAISSAAGERHDQRGVGTLVAQVHPPQDDDIGGGDPLAVRPRRGRPGPDRRAATSKICERRLLQRCLRRSARATNGCRRGPCRRPTARRPADGPAPGSSPAHRRRGRHAGRRRRRSS